MSATTGLLVIIIVILAAMYMMRPLPQVLNAGADDTMLNATPVEGGPYAYGSSSVEHTGYNYTFSPDYIPVNSYGTTRDYKQVLGRFKPPTVMQSPSQQARNVDHFDAKRDGPRPHGLQPLKPVVSFVPPMGRPRPLPHSYATTTSRPKPAIVKAR